ncbi:MAG: hypothetical protein N0E48_28675, partial [Candidatus Thiodiazotropha endolucinida]|nr:hypothetical protein [Candidatus Thiodiazotropha taylori]MCW4347292.1 hypothetical protein [Candidatus Thiodiazotropha endolucinida]
MDAENRNLHHERKLQMSRAYRVGGMSEEALQQIADNVKKKGGQFEVIQKEEDPKFNLDGDEYSVSADDQG